MRERAVMSLVCLLVALGALGIAAATVISGAVETQGLDAIFVILICLLAALAFSMMPAQAIRSGALRELLKRKPQTAAPTERASVAAVPEKPQEGN